MPVYDNAWLGARRGAFTGASGGPEQKRDIMHSPEEQARRRGRAMPETQLGFDPVEEARRYLDAPSSLDPINVQDVAETDRRMDFGRAKRQALESSVAEDALTNPMPMSLRALQELAPNWTQTLDTLGQAAQAGSIPAMFAPGTQGVAAGLGVGGTVARVPDMLRRSLNDDPSDDPGVGEGAMALLGLIPGAGKAFQRGSKAGRGISDANRPMGPSRWEVEGIPDSPNFQRAAAPKVQPYSVPKPKPKPTWDPLSWAEQSSGAGRTVNPGTRAPLNGLYDQVRSMMRREADYGATSMQSARGSIDDFVSGGMKGPVTDLSNRLGGLSPAQARARQRFGRVFRSE
jgi:hypothetical protein